MDYFTATPNAYYDEWMPILSNVEWRVLCCVVRRTAGYHLAAAPISLSLFQTATGITHRTQLSQAIKSLEARGLLTLTRQRTAQGGHAATLYTPLVPGAHQESAAGALASAGDALGVVPEPRLRVVPERHPLNKETNEAPVVTPEEAAIWQQTQEKLRGEMSARNYELRLASVALVARTGDVWSIQAPTHHQHIELVSQRWGRLIERALGSVVGYAIKLRFVPPSEITEAG